MLGDLGTDIGTLTKLEELIQKVVEKFNTKRTVVLQVENETPFTLHLIANEHQHGGFAETPDFSIPPGKVSVFGSQSAAWSIATGTEGSITYAPEEVDDKGRDSSGQRVVISWDNPFLGENSCSALSSASWLSAEAVCGAGNDAKMRYAVRYDSALRDRADEAAKLRRKKF